MTPIWVLVIFFSNTISRLLTATQNPLLIMIAKTYIQTLGSVSHIPETGSGAAMCHLCKPDFQISWVCLSSTIQDFYTTPHPDSLTHLKYVCLHHSWVNPCTPSN